jgi:hypothetical protein
MRLRPGEGRASWFFPEVVRTFSVQVCKRGLEGEETRKKEIPIPTKVEVDSEMQEAQGPNKASKEDIRMEDSSWMIDRPIPPKPILTASKELAFTSKPLAAQDLEDGNF